ncbi:MAG: 4Fe-4S binding protein [Clostridiaceae bacterium]|nr:4Fe-4S binding protein [Clostridiaceae bacterium]
MIYYFSGSGNSRHVAKLLARESGQELFSLNKFFKDKCRFRKGRDLIECSEPLPLPDDKNQVLVFVHPTYGWRQPRLLTSFLAANARQLKHRKLYFVATAGSGFGGSEKYLLRLCRDVGAEYMGLATILMPENYTAMFAIPDEPEADRLIQAGEARAQEAAAAIRAGSKLLPDPGLCKRPFLLSTVVNPLFYKFIVKSRAFYADDRCDSCRVCQLICPLNCISMETDENGDLRPHWSDNCTHCMACINHCPRQAIEYGRASHNKRRYFI